MFFGKGFFVPQLRQVALGYFSGEREFYAAPDLAAPGEHLFALGHWYGVGFPGDEAVVHARFPAQQDGISGYELAVFDDDDVAGLQFVKADGALFAAFFAPCGDGKVGAVVALEGNMVVGALLEPFSDEEEKDQPRKAVHVPRSAQHQDFPGAAHEKHGDAQRQRYVNGQLPVFEAQPGRAEIIRTAVKRDGDGQQDVEVAEPPDEEGICSRFEAQILREAEQHNVAKGKPCDAQFIGKGAVGDGALALVHAAQVDGGGISDAGQQLHYFAQRGFFL